MTRLTRRALLSATAGIALMTQSPTLSAALAAPKPLGRPGDFDFACLIAGHYQAGMVGKITVR